MTLLLPLLFTTTSSALMALSQDEPSSLRARIEIHTPALPARTLTWGALPLEVSIDNVGELKGIPMSLELLSGAYAGALLTVRVQNAGDESRSIEEFCLEPVLRTGCYNSMVELLPPGEHRQMSGTASVKLRQVPVSPGLVRDELISAFPQSGLYRLQACYSFEGREVASNVLEVQATAPEGIAATALQYFRGLGREGLWVYHPQLMDIDRVSGPARLKALSKLADEFGANIYSDHARLSLARHYLRDALNWTELGLDRGARDELLLTASRHLQDIQTPNFPRIDEVDRLSRSVQELRAR
jgi:hypothetical protein